MDLDLAKELSKLQERKLALEAGTDLRDKCDTIVELNRRVGLLSEDVLSLHNEVVQRFDLDDVWQKLSHPYKVLHRTNRVMDLLVGLNKLNGICRWIDANPNLIHSEDGQTIKLNPRRAITSGMDDENGDEKSTVLLVLDLLEEFESIYKPLEQVLSNRSDLPYKTYATKVRSFIKSILEKLKHDSG